MLTNNSPQSAKTARMRKMLERASKRNLTADEIQKQKASFVWGQLSDDHPMSKQDVEAHLSGFAPYTPVTVSQHTVAYQESDRQAYERRLRELSEPPYGTDVKISQEPLDYWKSPSK